MLYYAESVREVRSKGWRSPDYQSEGAGIRTLSPLRRFRQGPSYSPNRLVSQSATLKECSVQGCKRAKHNTYSPLNDHWVILSTSKAFRYFLARRCKKSQKCSGIIINFLEKFSLKNVIYVMLKEAAISGTVLIYYYIYFIWYIQAVYIFQKYRNMWRKIHMCS